MSDPTPPPGGRGLTFGELVATLRRIERDEHPTGPFCTINGAPAAPAVESYARIQYFVRLADQRRQLQAAAGYDELRTLLLRHTNSDVIAAACGQLLGQFLTAHPHLSATEAEALPLPDFVRQFLPPVGDPPAGAPTRLGPAVDGNEVAILTALNAAHPLVRHVFDLTTATGLSKGTVQAGVTTLIVKGLAERPGGPRGGATITAAGRAVIRSLT
jgi:hypothetical protein